MAVDLHKLMGSNGWEWLHYDRWTTERDGAIYKATFTGQYTCDVIAIVACNKNDITIEGHLGVLWLEIIGTPYFTFDEISGYCYYHLDAMNECLMLAEENLVRCGIPLSPLYKFRSKNKANLKRRNEATRKRLGIAELEHEMGF